MNPMQPLLNALVYRKWNANKWRCLQLCSKKEQKERIHFDEQSPLLSSEPRLHLKPVPPSINTYATL